MTCWSYSSLMQCCSRRCRPLFEAPEGEVLLHANLWLLGSIYLIFFCFSSYKIDCSRTKKITSSKDLVFLCCLLALISEKYAVLFCLWELLFLECSSGILKNSQHCISFLCNMLIGCHIWWDLFLLIAQNFGGVIWICSWHAKYLVKLFTSHVTSL